MSTPVSTPNNPDASTGGVNGAVDSVDIPRGNPPGATSVAYAASKAAADWRGNDASVLSDSASQIVAQVQNHISKAAQAIARAEQDAHKALTDLRVYPEGRQVMANDIIAKGSTEAGEAIESARVGLQVAQADLTIQAMPKMSKGEELTARQDALMLLNGKGDLVAKIKTLSARQDSIGALVSQGDWIKMWGQSTGMDSKTVDALVIAARESALNAAADQSDDLARQRAARAVRHTGKLAGAIGGVESARRGLRPRF